METEPQVVNTVLTQKTLSVILDEIEQRTKGLAYYADRKQAQIDNAALVKALRRAMQVIRLGFPTAEAEITAILTNAGNGQAEKDL